MKIKEDIELNNNGFAFDPSNGESYALNKTGITILQLLQKGFNNKEIENEILNTYNIDEYQLKSDLNDFFILLKEYEITEDGKA